MIVTAADGTRYEAEIAQITKTMLGREHHTPTFNIQLQLRDGAHATFGGYSMQRPDCMDLLTKIIEAGGVETWEQLPGTRVLALFRQNDAFGGMIQGIASLMDPDATITYDHDLHTVPDPATYAQTRGIRPTLRTWEDVKNHPNLTSLWINIFARGDECRSRFDKASHSTSEWEQIKENAETPSGEIPDVSELEFSWVYMVSINDETECLIPPKHIQEAMPD